jgi:hypothetical protein
MRRGERVDSVSAMSALIEITSPPVSMTKYAGRELFNVPFTIASRWTRIGRRMSASPTGRSFAIVNMRRS